ncbi:hypothetical protein [Bathymodiolus japonicus methanotrophic gill symbiont]|uniref:hypothetical protein n=1 Tax=Bathymodiolus japonicus methanotrophic gill symbiont TaxID=113269 RepID=UPI001C8E2B9F|nr:hypothetical protein [Bathymodiolus japonicus methanotrophic gill symbiont]
MTKVNEFINKNNINGTTKLSKKTPLILKRIFDKKSLKPMNQWLRKMKVTKMG